MALRTLSPNLKKGSTSKDLPRSESQIKDVTDRLILLLEEIQGRVVQVFEEAEKRLQNPNVRIVKKLDKKDDEIKTYRAANLKLEIELSKCRSSREALDKRMRKLSIENEELRSENTNLKNNEQAWTHEIRGVRPLKGR